MTHNTWFSITCCAVFAKAVREIRFPDEQHCVEPVCGARNTNAFEQKSRHISGPPCSDMQPRVAACDVSQEAEHLTCIGSVKKLAGGTDAPATGADEDFHYGSPTHGSA